MGALGLLIGPGIAGGTTDLGAAFTFGGNLGGAKLILVDKETGGLVVVDVLDTSPLVSFEVPLVSFVVPLVSFVVPLVSFVVPLVVALCNGFFAGAESGRLKGLGEPLVSDCLVSKVDVRGVVLSFGVVGDFVANVFGVVEVLGDDVSVVLVILVLGVVGVVLAEVGRGAGLLSTEVVVFGADFVTVVDFIAVFRTVVGRTLVAGFEVVDGAVKGLDNGFDVVDEVFLGMGADVFEAKGLVGVVFVVVVLVLETVVSIFLGADLWEANPTPATAAIAAVPTAAATAISAT